MSHIRPAAVAGMFYPANAAELDAAIGALLDHAGTRPPGRPPKAIIAPHAGYIYSGPVAAEAYACLAPFAADIHRVVLIGPCHRVPLRGIAVSSADAFATPLGPVPIDGSARAAVLELPQVSVFDATHAEEHCLEVHLPFLQKVLRDFAIVPLVAGQAGADEVAEVLDRLWGGPETVIVVSSDLSHYLDYDSARALDAATCHAIEALKERDIGVDQACGRVAIAGLLTLARRRGLVARTLDVRNSGDTAGDRRRVVGYGAWLFEQPAAGTRVGEVGNSADPAIPAIRRELDAMVQKWGPAMLALAKASIAHGLDAGEPLHVEAATKGDVLAKDGAAFVTLYGNGRLRGCIGSARARRPLACDIAENAFAAAFEDPRFAKLSRDELADLEVSVSVLSEPMVVSFTSVADLIDQLQPGVDGLIIEADGRRALFLPQVWKMIPAPPDFLAELRRKAGLAADAWPEDTRAWRFWSASWPAGRDQAPRGDCLTGGR